MKVLLLLLIATFSITASAKSLYDFTLKTTSKKELKLKDYKNKAVLFVNVATRCGYTGQLDGLEKIYKKYKSKDLVIIGVPSNDFGSQTPEDNKGVEKFCRLKYGVTFPLTEKAVITGDKKSDLYKFLLSKSDNEEIQWNFTKFLFDKKGNLVKRYGSSTAPSSESLISDIEKTLK